MQKLQQLLIEPEKIHGSLDLRLVLVAVAWNNAPFLELYQFSDQTECVFYTHAQIYIL